MTAFYKVIEDGCVIGFGTNGNDLVTPISGQEYDALAALVRAAPKAPAGFQYRLRADTLVWELSALPEPGDAEVTAEEIVSAIEEAIA